ncbi:hypothetical protein ACORG1_33875 (plasmid) [Mycobacterium sp. TJFP1]|uniref:hypothetical protein n=1 Tax=Mycobacterium sp. MS1601 TaxID=1936029 RepID=UPI001F2291A3|nr:hypothetical protein [Mycobacterium sp. MS1601]
MGEVIEFGRGGTGPDYADAKFSIKDVAEASGLPQPAIAQLISRTWTAAGWMYTAAQLQEAVDYASRHRMAQDVSSAAADGTGQRPADPDAMTVAARIADARSKHPSADLTNRDPREG